MYVKVLKKYKKVINGAFKQIVSFDLAGTERQLVAADRKIVSMCDGDKLDLDATYFQCLSEAFWAKEFIYQVVKRKKGKISQM